MVRLHDEPRSQQLLPKDADFVENIVYGTQKVNVNEYRSFEKPITDLHNTDKNKRIATMTTTVLDDLDVAVSRVKEAFYPPNNKPFLTYQSIEPEKSTIGKLYDKAKNWITDLW